MWLTSISLSADDEYRETYDDKGSDNHPRKKHHDYFKFHPPHLFSKRGELDECSTKPAPSFGLIHFRGEKSG